MSISMYTASVPVFATMLGNLSHFIDKAKVNAQSRGFDVNVLAQSRLAPDMLPFTRQILIACDAAKLAVARIGGIEAPKFDDTETTMDELQQRIARTIAFLETVQPGQLDGSEEREITFPVGRDRTRTMKAEAYLKHWALPNVFFHVTTAYALLRHNGVDLGKTDYLLGANKG